MPNHMVKDRCGKWHNALGAVVLLSGQTYVVKNEGDYAGHYILESVKPSLSSMRVDAKVIEYATYVGRAKPKLIQRVRGFEPFPKGYGYIPYTHSVHDLRAGFVAPIPLNIILGAWFRLIRWLHLPNDGYVLVPKEKAR